MKDRLKVGIVGARRGAGHIRPFTTITETEVTAICDLNEDTLHEVGEQYGVPKRFTDYEEMLADDIDIVVLGTPENSACATVHFGVGSRKACDQRGNSSNLPRTVLRVSQSGKKEQNEVYDGGEQVLYAIEYADRKHGPPRLVRRPFTLARANISMTSKCCITIAVAIQLGDTIGRSA